MWHGVSFFSGFLLIKIIKLVFEKIQVRNNPNDLSLKVVDPRKLDLRQK